jgi:hypothetical protein
MAVAGSYRITVDALRADPLSLAALQGLVDAHHQRISFRPEKASTSNPSRMRLAS